MQCDQNEKIGKNPSTARRRRTRRMYPRSRAGYHAPRSAPNGSRATRAGPQSSPRSDTEASATANRPAADQANGARCVVRTKKYYLYVSARICRRRSASVL